MAAQVQLLRFSFVIFFFSGVYSVNFTIKNNCPYPIWPGTLNGFGDKFSTTPFGLPSGSSAITTIHSPWTGRFWARSHCFVDGNGRVSCGEDCAPGHAECHGVGAPITVVDFTIAPKGGLDFYDICLVYGFNLPVSVVPQGGSTECTKITCAGNINSVCPPELAVKGKDGAVVACKSACTAFNKPEFCCSGAHDQPKTCSPTNYSKIFKNQCPQAISYGFDDVNSIIQCSGGPDYAITFCP